MPAPAASDPVEILPSANVSAINDSAAKILSSDASPRKSAITGSISNATRPSPFNTSTASGSTLIPTRRPAFLPPSIAGSTTYVERRSESRVINMDAPEARLTELTTKSRTAAFVLLPGERVLNSPSVTMHIRRSVWVHGDHWPWHSHQKLALGKLTSRVNPQVSPLSPTSGTITVQATIDKDGRVQDLKHLNGSFAFFPSVAIAVREWHYDPTYVDNKPVETQAQIEVDFHPPATRASRP
jgi:Gram-negative bacterial TonB protein C-terminal